MANLNKKNKEKANTGDNNNHHVIENNIFEPDERKGETGGQGKTTPKKPENIYYLSLYQFKLLYLFNPQ